MVYKRGVWTTLYTSENLAEGGIEFSASLDASPYSFGQNLTLEQDLTLDQDWGKKPQIIMRPTGHMPNFALAIKQQDQVLFISPDRYSKLRLYSAPLMHTGAP